MSDKVAESVVEESLIFFRSESDCPVKLRVNRVADPSRVIGSTTKSDLWAYLWGASPVLAQLVFFLPSQILERRRILEIGCGSGIVGIATAMHSPNALQVLATDFVPEALNLVRQSAQLNNVSALLETKLLNWNDETMDADLEHSMDLIFGADVVYMRHACKHVANVLRRCLKDDGLAIIVDPGRANVDDFISACEDLELYTNRMDFENIGTPLCILKRVHIVLVARKDFDLSNEETIASGIVQAVQKLTSLNSNSLEQNAKPYGFCLKTK